MKVLRYTLMGLAALLILVQFVPNELPEVAPENPADLLKGDWVQADVAQLLKTSCYNCHSNETDYPWYSYVAPSSWLVARDVRKARKELNLSTWTNLDVTDKLSKLDDISEEVGEGNMPLPIYTFMHPSAKLSEQQRQLIVQWTETAMDKLVEEEEAEEAVVEEEDTNN